MKDYKQRLDEIDEELHRIAINNLDLGMYVFGPIIALAVCLIIIFGR